MTEEQKLTCSECGTALAPDRIGFGVFTAWGPAPFDFKPHKLFCVKCTKEYVAGLSDSD